MTHETGKTTVHSVFEFLLFFVALHRMSAMTIICVHIADLLVVPFLSCYAERSLVNCEAFARAWC